MVHLVPPLPSTSGATHVDHWALTKVYTHLSEPVAVAVAVAVAV